MKDIIILGAGGNCIDVLDAINEINKLEMSPKYRCVGFLDDNRKAWGTKVFGVEVLGPLESACSYPDSNFFAHALGSTSYFWRKREILDATGISLDRFVTIVHPSACVSEMSSLGLGTVILQNATVASNATIGNHVVVLANSVINHDVNVKDYTCITSGVCVSGCVTVGEACYLGTNSSMIGGITIGDCSLIGMGAVVLSDVEENSVMVGCPARFLRHTR